MAGPSGGLPDLQTTLALAAASSGGNSNEGGNVNDSKRKHECLECGKRFPTPSKAPEAQLHSHGGETLQLPTLPQVLLAAGTP